MDLKVFYQKMRAMEATIADDPTLVSSLATSDGGKAGVVSEVPRAVAARLLVEGRARVASEDEAAEFRANTAKERQRLEDEANAGRVRLTVISDSQLRALKGRDRPKE